MMNGPFNSKLHLRTAKISDLDLLYKWANDSDVRKNSFNSNFIPYENHVIWFNKMMENPSVLQYILEYDSLPVGQIRLNVNEDNAEIGYSIASEYRGKGFGHRILQLVKEILKKTHPEIHTLVAKVKPDNDASNKLFQKENFKTDYICYSCPINDQERV